ncbi:MAG: ATP-dependent DNA helicase RecG [Paramuribaculum sp.]|nr:ATP-dependent DNA helicase RecG [Paramuribaculum sp.]
MERLRSTDVKYLKGVGPKRAELLCKQLGIKTCADLLCHFPTHYVDRSRIYRVADFAGDMPSVQVRGRFVSFATQGEGAKTRLIGLFSDGSRAMEVVWFNRIKNIRDTYLPGVEYILFGKPTEFGGRWSMVHPEIDRADSPNVSVGFRGVYPLTETLRNRGISSRTIYNMVSALLPRCKDISDPLPEDLRHRYRLMSLGDALSAVHSPANNDELQKARMRLKFEELFYLQLNILRYCRERSESVPGFRFGNIGYYFNTFYKECLPFELTGAQKRVIKEIRHDVGSGKQMNRLLQGDVGSGNTLVSLMCMIMALDNGTQDCLMAPTEILATQHFETISALASKIGVNIKLLTGSTPKREREAIHAALQDGSLHILIGTHAVIEDSVKFRNLGFVVIDEQHRFGVAQRARLWKKNSVAPHILVMTATPIPRTLAMTVYGDLDVSVIDELPPGRKPIQTLLRYEDKRMDVYRSIGKQLKLGRQAYIVYPLISENEKLDLKSLEEGYEFVRESFPSYKVAYVHGRMKPAEKDYQMSLFANGEAQILVATTVIEVGVNVPNASVMVIENAERFGLSQLHQLRGRVGRGADQSYCVLMTKVKIAKETRKRLEVMTSTTDGFVVAEADLKMRGPGDLEGTLQSGMAVDLRIASLATDGQIVQLARNAANEVLDADPALASSSLSRVKREMSLMFDKSYDWSRIS